MADVKPEPVKLPDVLVVAFTLLPGFLSERVAAYYSLSPRLSEVETVASDWRLRW